MINCETTFCPSTLGSMRWLYLEVHMLPVKEKKLKMQIVFLNVKLHLWLKPNSLSPIHHLWFGIDKHIF
jgi:hypothetical protein